MLRFRKPAKNWTGLAKRNRTFVLVWMAILFVVGIVCVFFLKP